MANKNLGDINREPDGYQVKLERPFLGLALEGKEPTAFQLSDWNDIAANAIEKYTSNLNK